MITKISHFTLFVRDQAAAYDVYVNKLGFKVSADMTMENGMRWLTVTPPGQPDVNILLARPQSPMVPEKLVAAIVSLLDANALGGGVWECDDCQKTYETLKSRGIEFMKSPRKEFYGIEALFRDGCGNWFSLTQRIPQS